MAGVHSSVKLRWRIKGNPTFDVRGGSPQDAPWAEGSGCSVDERRLCKVDALLGTETGDLAKKPKSQTLQQPNRCSIGGLGLGHDTAKLHCAERMDQRLANGLRGTATAPIWPAGQMMSRCGKRAKCHAGGSRLQRGIRPRRF